MAATAAIVGAVAAAGGTAYSIDQNEQAKRTASQRQDAQKIDMAHAKSAMDAQQKQNTEQAANTAAATALRNRTRQAAAGLSFGGGGTLLTSGLGSPAQPGGGAKTLLGV